MTDLPPSMSPSALSLGVPVHSIWRVRLRLNGNGQSTFPSQDLHHTLDRLISLQLAMHESAGVISASDNFCAINLKPALNRHSLKQVGKYLRASGGLSSKLCLTFRRWLGKMSEVFPPLVQHGLALPRSPSPPAIVKRDSDAVERLNMRGAHSRSSGIHQRGEHPGTHIGRLARPFHPLLSLDGKHRAEQGCQNNQSITNGDRALSSGRGGRSGVRGGNQHGASLGSFPHSATEATYG